MQSITYGELTLREVALKITEFISLHARSHCNIIIGTDSQNFETTKIVLVIAVYSKGNGGIFFYDTKFITKLTTIREKLIEETQLSLDLAESLFTEFVSLDFDYTQIDFSIHVDVGTKGKTKELIPELVSWVNSSGYACVIKPNSIAASSIADKYSK